MQNIPTEAPIRRYNVAMHVICLGDVTKEELEERIKLSMNSNANIKGYYTLEVQPD